MATTADRILSGARWSEAVRCEHRAALQGLGVTPTDERPRWLENAFDRGIPVGEMWGLVQGNRLRAQGHEVSLEHVIPWGPPEFEWEGHADLLDLTDCIVDEAYHSKDLEFREVKALQNAGYVDLLDESTGRPHRGVLTAINAADGDRNDGMALKRYPIVMDGPNGLRPRVRGIRERVIAAVQAGDAELAPRVSDTPNHTECQACPFLSVCHAGWTPPAPEEVVGLETTVDALRVTESDYHHATAALERIKERRDQLRDEIRPYTQPGIPLDAGTGVLVKRIEVAGRTSVQLGAFTKAGYAIPAELEPFVKHGAASERWTITEPTP